MTQDFMPLKGNITTKRKCLKCDSILIGRSDKKFCDDYCRIAYNNKNTVSRYGHIRSITRRLIKNRNILEKWANKKTTPIQLNDLISEGFTLSYATEFINQPVGTPYIYCFDYGYQLLPGNNCRVLKQSFTKATLKKLRSL
jgi:hypothetical protein